MRKGSELAHPHDENDSESSDPIENQRTGQTAQSTDPAPHQRPVRTIWKILAFAGMAIAGVGFAGLVSIIVGVVFGQEITPAVLYMIAAPVVILSSWACLRLFDHRPLAAVGIGFDRAWMRHGVGGGLLGAGLLGICVVIFRIAGWAETTDFPGGAIPWAGLLIGAVHTLGLAIHEEVQCRGYPFQLLLRWNPAVAVVLTGAFFVAMHLPNPGGLAWSAMLNMFLLHLLLAACYLRTRSLWLPIGVHFGWNYMMGYVLGMPVSGVLYSSSAFSTTMSQGIWTGHAFGPEGGMIVTAALALAAALAWTLLPQRHPTPDLLAE